MVNTELRTDPITGRAVLVDLAPFKRRDDFELTPVRLEDPPAGCPLCEGREADAGPEILAWREGGPANVPGWSVRVVANRNPMLKIEGTMDLRSQGLFESRDGLGAHEVIVETPIHDQPLHTLEADRLWRVLWAWRTRMQDLKRDSRFTSIVIVKNHGRAAGANLDHSHSQLTAFPMLPPALSDKVRGAARHLARTDRCIFCDLVSEELNAARRVIGAWHQDPISKSGAWHQVPISKSGAWHQPSVLEGDAWHQPSILAIAPFASRVPFETWLMPAAHAPRFEEANDATLHALAAAIRSVMAAIDWALERPACNLVLHTAPLGGEADRAFHWHLEIIPRVTRFSGVEWGTGVHRNPVAPEAAAEALRDQLRP